MLETRLDIDLSFAKLVGHQIFSRQENTELKKRTKKEAALELVLWIEKLFKDKNKPER